jgi:hypothetical protein
MIAAPSCSGRVILPTGGEVLLGELIAWPWRDPGPVPLKQRVGASRSLGPDRRAIGVPGGFDYLLEKRALPQFPNSVPHTPHTFVARPSRPFARNMRMAFATFGGSIPRRSMNGSRASGASPHPFRSQMRAMAVERINDVPFSASRSPYINQAISKGTFMRRI